MRRAEVPLSTIRAHTMPLSPAPPLIRRRLQVIIIAHQLLVKPVDAAGNFASWLQLPDDMVENADEVQTCSPRARPFRLA